MECKGFDFIKEFENENLISEEEDHTFRGAPLTGAFCTFRCAIRERSVLFAKVLPDQFLRALSGSRMRIGSVESMRELQAPDATNLSEFIVRKSIISILVDCHSAAG